MSHASGRSEPGLVVRLLGAPEIRRGGEPVRFDTRKAVALVAYLAVTGRRHTREELAALLWPESDRSRSRSALRRTLSTAGGVGPALLVDRAGVELDTASVDCDVHTFTEAVDGSVADARRAVDVYRGDFLEGFTLRDSPAFEDWCAGVQDRLRRDLDRHLALLVDDRVAHGGLDEAIDLAGRRVLLDPLSEAAHRSLMALYEWNGQRADSLRQYRRCVRALERELGVAPLPETTAVYDAVRRHQLPRPDELPDLGPALPGTRRSAAPVAPAPAPAVFVGRVSELAALAAAWDRAGRDGYAVAVVGEVGSGKTALLSSFTAALEGQGSVGVLSVRGHEGEQDLAYGAATDLARALLRADLGEGVDDDVEGRAMLAWLAPAGGRTADTFLPAPAAPLDRARVFGAVRTSVEERRRSHRSGLVLVVEDAHWLDPESADLIAYLVRRPVPGVLLVATWRGTVSPTAVASALAEALTDDRGAVLRLGPFDAEEVAAVLAAHHRPDDDAAVEQVRARTGGLPLLVVETARAASEPDAALAGDLDALVRARLDAAPEATRQVVTAVAVFGAPLDPDLVRSVSGRTDQEVVTALDDAVARGLLVELTGGADYDVPHDTLRRLAAEDASAARRRLLHRRAADALAAPGARPERGPGWSGTVARHFELAGRTEEATIWHVQAARQAAAVFGHATAELHWAAALALGFDAWEAHLGIGDARVRLGRYQEAVAAYEQAAAAAGEDEQLALVEHRLGEVRDRFGEHTLAEAHLEAALDLLESVDARHPRRARLLADLALVSLRLGDTARAVERAGAVVDGSTDPADDAAVAQAYDVLGVAAARDGDLAEARVLLRSSLEHARALADPAADIAALNNLARVEAQVGDLESAQELAGRALERSVVHGDTHRTAALHDHLADLLHRAGRDDEAQEHQRQAAAMFAVVDSDEQRRPEIWQLVEW